MSDKNEREFVEILERFCHPDRTPLSEPFSQGDYSYATDGKIAVRIQRLAQIAEKGTAPSMDRIPWDHNTLTDWQDLPVYDLRTVKSCGACCGAGIQKTCPECDGDGEVGWDTDFNEYAETCKTCEGDGHLPGDVIDSSPCYMCGGSGKDLTEPVRWGSGYIQISLLEKIKGLPEIKMSMHGDGLEAFRFVFLGGDGVIMPTAGGDRS